LAFGQDFHGVPSGRKRFRELSCPKCSDLAGRRIGMSEQNDFQELPPSGARCIIGLKPSAGAVTTDSVAMYMY